MKTLLLLRHAKSSWKEPELIDFDRPLNKRGLKAAPQIGQALSAKKLQPEVILSSPAKRAMQTVNLVIEAAGLKGELRFEEKIYEASARRLFELVSGLDPAVKMAMMVGHNPGFEELTAVLTNETPRLRTASLVCIEFEIDDWNKIKPGRGKLKWIVDPKSLGEDD
jgi:phosphohistidine phosphatase